MSDNFSSKSDLVLVRRHFEINRRNMLKGMAAFGGLAAAGFPSTKANAATVLSYVGWEGYDTFFEANDFPARNELELRKTFVSSPDEVITKLRLDSRQVDVCTPYFIHDDFLASEELLEPLDLAKIPNFDKVHPVIRDYCENNMSQDGIWYSVPMTYGAICMVYNADEIPEPTSWTDMLRDEYRGKCAITNDYPGNLFAWARVAGVEEPNRMTHDELDKTVALLIDLKRNHLRTIASSYGELINLLTSKEVVISQGWEPVSAWVGDSVNIKPAYPKEKSMGFIEGYAIGKGASNIDAAHALINHALSVEGQLAGAEWNTMPVVNADAMSKVNDVNKALYKYEALADYFTVKTDVVPMYPLESDGTHATWDDYQEAWERVLKG